MSTQRVTTKHQVAGADVHVTVEEYAEPPGAGGACTAGWFASWSDGPPAGEHGHLVRDKNGKTSTYADASTARDAAKQVAEIAIRAGCSHAWEKDRILGADTGDVVCTRCGKETWGGNVR